MSKRLLVLCATLALALLAIIPAPARAANNEIEAVLGYYYPSNIELEQLNTKLAYHETVSFGLRYGRRVNEKFGLGVTWSRIDLDSEASSENAIGCSSCDINLDFVDFSFEWYPGGSNWALYGGPGWASGDAVYNVPGSNNDFHLSDDAFTYHVGVAYAWNIGPSFYLRPDARIRFLQLDQSGRGKYDSEDPELRLGFGWRF